MSRSDSLLSRFIGGTISIGLGNLSAMVLNLLGTMVATRHLPAEAFGAFVLLQVVINFLTQFSSFGLDLSTAKFIADIEDEQHKRQLVNTATYFRLFMILIVSLVALIVGPALYAVFGSSLIPSLAAFVPILFLLESLSRLFKYVLQGFFLFRRIGIASFITSLLNFFLIVVFVQFLNRGVIGLIYARVISLSLLCAFIYLSIPILKKLEFHFSILKELLAFGFPLQINDILTFIFSRIDTLIIGALFGPAEIAYYEISRKIPESLIQFYEAFRSVYFPSISKLFARGERDKVTQVLNNSTRLVSFVTAVGALIAMVFGNDLIVLLFSERYLPSVPAFVLLMIALNVSLVGYTLGTTLVAVGESDKPAIINVVHMGASLLGNLILIPIFGIIGAALVSLVGSTVTNPLNVLFLKRKDVDIRVMDYLKPILIMVLIWPLVLLLRPTTFLQKALVVFVLILPLMSISVINGGALLALSNKVRKKIYKPMRKFLGLIDTKL